jgi:glycosyltransferase involved in cell wall biosynthesis
MEKPGGEAVKPAQARVRVLYSFPHRLGADRICYTAWQQVNGLAEAGVDVILACASLRRPVREGVKVVPTLSRGNLRIPYRLIGSMRAFALHDAIVAGRLRHLAGKIDIVHTWPLGALRTLSEAKRLGIPTVLERPNAHTRFALEVVKAECERLGVELPPDHEHAFNEEKLRIEEAEYALATRLLCPSEFVVRTFIEKGFSPSQLARHMYGVDPAVYFPSAETHGRERALTALFVGVCAVRKGVHFALEAWLRSQASRTGKFLIAGEFLPAYAEKLRPMLSHPNVKVLGHRTDIPELMRNSDILLLPSLEEGFGLVVTEAMSSGCVPLASDACTELCGQMQSGFVHCARDTRALTEQIDMLDRDRGLLERMRAACLCMVPDITWTAAGRMLAGAYRQTIEGTGGTTTDLSVEQNYGLDLPFAGAAERTDCSRVLRG